MVVSQEGPRLPKPDVKSDTFRKCVDHVFENDADAEELWRVVEIAKEQPHGTMVVISELAAEEADRLNGESTPIQAQRLESEYVMGVTAIDRR